MKTQFFTLAFTGALIVATGPAAAQQMDPNMPGMAGTQVTKPTEAQGVGIVKAIDPAKGTITLQHQAITAIGWPAMTMSFKVASPNLLKVAKVGDKVKFTLRPAGMASTVTSIIVER
ncbi:copper-binding protein [Fulvimonas sp. R45]|uniref:copper-binding protein n=1 Tax=Fulvimonas sp. R45 TaxID=3045937 RepID=UPI00265DF099|nr:copper-binding protein [Fulvimonas sp. R45]MDO1530559.1 copper-binding protein [Fulvimonas sp. R45]